MAGGSEDFDLSGGVFAPVEQNGSTLTLSGTTYTYTRSNGTSATFESVSGYTFGNVAGISIATLTYPSQRSLTFHYVTASYGSGSATRTGRRLQSVTTNAGYHMKLSYVLDTVASSTDEANWSRMIRVKGLNMAVDSCTVTAFSCPQSGRPELYMPSPVSYTDSEGRTTSYTISSIAPGTRALTGIKLPGSTSNDITIGYTSGVVDLVTRFGVTTGYAYATAGSTRTVTITGPGGATRVVKFDTSKSVMTSDQDERGKITEYQYDANNRPTRVTQPEGNYTQLTYDSRGNVTEQRAVAKSGSGVPDMVVTATYPSCTSGVTCNKPETTTDIRGNVTDYVWDATKGGALTSVKGAGATMSSNRPETRISYSRLDATGTASSTGIWVPTGTSTCQTGTATGTPSCVGTADEVKTTIGYGYGLLPTSVSSGAGDNSLTATTSSAYDVIGNLETVDGPLATSADTTRFRYNLNRELIGTVGPDPDGTGSRKHLAQRTTFDGKGLVTKQESGSVNGYSDTDWAAFVTAHEMQLLYNANRRLSRSTLASGGTAYAITQLGYDTRGRLQCSAQRMKYVSLPASACDRELPAGAFGDDRITQYSYDPVSNVTEVRVGLGTGAEAARATYTYTDNGLLQTLKDGENNLTKFEYDGQDRPWRTFFPSTAKGAGTSSTNDFEQLTYETRAGGSLTSLTVASRQLRNPVNPSTAPVISFQYDNPGRVTLKDLPGSEPDVSYGYDLLDRMTSASQTGNALAFTYDALGRLLTEQQQHGTIQNQYDVAGRRTRITYTDTAKRIDYAYDALGLLTDAYYSNGTSTMVQFENRTYDSLARLTGISRGGGSMSYGYDPVSRLSSIALDWDGTSADTTMSFTYNPASQIVTRGNSNDSYAWSATSGSTASTANGLNQIDSIGGGTPTYDGRGNLLTDPTTSKTYGYSSENLLTSATGGVTLSYDPLGRLSQISTSTATRRFVYDGPDMVEERDGSGAMLRRFAFGQGPDDVILMDGGSALDCSATRFPRQDERGSVIAWGNCWGMRAETFAYDEFGRAQGPNLQRAMYTGQMYVPEIALSYYKARMYAPHLGRFVQADPIGYAPSPNLYAYVQNDPVNLIDPLGLEEDDILVIGHLPFNLFSGGGATGVSRSSYSAAREPRDIVVIGRRPSRDQRASRLSPEPVLNEIPFNLVAHQSREVDRCTASPEGTPMGDSFAAACAKHDRCYMSIGANREQCDTAWLNDMIQSCAGSTHRFLCEQYALRYYLVIRRYGWVAFWYEQRRARP